MNAQSRNPSASRLARNSGTPVAAVAKAGVCVALVVALAWIAGTSDGGRDPATAAAVAATPRAATTFTGDSAAAHRRELFDERRARFSARANPELAGQLVSAVQAP